MSYVTLADGGSLFYEVHGRGEPVVLISGLNGLASFWRQQIDALAQRYQVLVFDHRGMGSSSPWPESRVISVAQLRDDLLGLLDALSIPSAHIVGHSLGGAIAQTLSLIPKFLILIIMA